MSYIYMRPHLYYKRGEWCAVNYGWGLFAKAPTVAEAYRLFMRQTDALQERLL